LTGRDQPDQRRLRLLGTEAATPGAVAVLRRRAASLARAAGAGEDVLDGVVLAISEAVTNVVQHAYNGASAPGPVAVYAAVAGSLIDFVVLDEGMGPGEWATPASGGGLMLIATVATRFAVQAREPAGTSVWMRFVYSDGSRRHALRGASGSRRRGAARAPVGP
jgi:anti-sigma regulatory factor (Ser/Thr protein kinase)